VPHRGSGMGRRRIDSAIPSPSRRRRRRRVWQMADGLINDRRGRSGVARRSVASVKPVFAQATLGTHWALIPRQNLEDFRFASLTVDTQHHGKENRARRFARFGGQEHRWAEERVGGVGAGGGERGGASFSSLACACKLPQQRPSRPWPSNAADPQTRGKSTTTQLRP
jgi:hypothetical protein